MRLVKILLVILCACTATNLSGQDKSTSTGSLQLKIDVADDNGVDAITQVIVLKNLVASEIEPFIQARLSRYGAVQVNDPTNTIIITDKPTKVKDLVSLVQKLDETGIKDFLRLETEAIKLKYIAPSKIRPYIEKRLSSEGIISYNDELNLLVITDLKSRIANIKKILPQFDVMPKQVVIELKVYDITSLNQSNTGLDPFQILKSIDGQWSSQHYSSTRQYEYDPSQHATGTDTRINTNVDMDELIANIEQSSTNNRMTLISNPIIMVQNRCWGRISTDVGFYYGDDQYQYNRQYYQDVLYFSVYPKITESGIIEINSNIRFENNNELSYSNELESNATTTNNKTILLGKIHKKVDKKKHEGVPLFKDIPLFGFLFGKVTKTYEYHEFIVLATPRIYEAGSGMTDSLKIQE